MQSTADHNIAAFKTATRACIAGAEHRANLALWNEETMEGTIEVTVAKRPGGSWAVTLNAPSFRSRLPWKALEFAQRLQMAAEAAEWAQAFIDENGR